MSWESGERTIEVDKAETLMNYYYLLTSIASKLNDALANMRLGEALTHMKTLVGLLRMDEKEKDRILELIDESRPQILADSNLKDVLETIRKSIGEEAFKKARIMTATFKRFGAEGYLCGMIKIIPNGNHRVYCAEYGQYTYPAAKTWVHSKVEVIMRDSLTHVFVKEIAPYFNKEMELMKSIEVYKQNREARKSKIRKGSQDAYPEGY